MYTRDERSYFRNSQMKRKSPESPKYKPFLELGSKLNHAYFAPLFQQCYLFSSSLISYLDQSVSRIYARQYILHKVN